MAKRHERFWPSLLDRLDSEADAKSRDQHFVDPTTLRVSVAESLEMLLNTTCLEATLVAAGEGDLSDFPEVQASIVNYGVPDIVGRILSGVRPLELQRGVSRAVSVFEPRISPGTGDGEVVSVSVDPEQERDGAGKIRMDEKNGLTLHIAGRVHGTPEEYIEISTRLNDLRDRTEVLVE